MDIIILDKFNNSKEKIKLKKPESFEDLVNKIRQKLKNIFQYFEIFIVDNNENEIKISNQNDYKFIEDLLFVRETEQDVLEQSMFEINNDKISETNRDILDENYTCKICFMIIKNEKPYFCYNCQKIFHQQCLKEWDNKSKSQNRNLYCPNCRNYLPLEKWRKKLDFEDNKKQITNLINKVNDTRENKYINIIKDKKIKELKEKNSRQNDLIESYEQYIEKTIDIFKNILEQINIISFTLKLSKYNRTNNKLKDLILMYPLNINNLEIDDISKVIYEELVQIKMYWIKANNININKMMKYYNKMMNETEKSNEKISKNKYNKQINNYIHSSNIKENNSKNMNNENINNKKKKLMKKDSLHESKLDNEYKNKINLIYNAYHKGNYNIFGDKFVENNKNNIDLIINGRANSLINECYLNGGENTITIIIKHKLTNLSYMFESCKSLKDIDELKYLDVSKTKNFSYMFSGCSSLLNFDSLQNWDVSNSYNFEGMFEGCSYLVNVEAFQNWNVVNCNNFSNMFSGCSSLVDVYYLKNWDVSNCSNFGGMFLNCSLLSDITGLEDWNVLNSENFEEMFRECQSLADITPLENWNVSNVSDFSGMFWGCKKLLDIKPLENWDISNNACFNDMFFGCSSSLDIKPLLSWNISKEDFNTMK